MTRKQRIHFILVFLLFAMVCPTVEPASRGKYRYYAAFKYIENYTKEDYNHFPQNWSILQDDRGVLYVGNQGALLEYDGFNWHRHVSIRNYTVRSMTKSNDGTIFIGGKGEIGYLTAGDRGKLKYVSLVHLLPEEDRNFSNVFETHNAAGSTWFWTGPELFRLHNGSVTNVGTFKGVFSWKGKFYMQKEGEGILEAAAGIKSQRVLPGSKAIANERICMAVPFGDEKLLLGIRYKGFYLYNGTAATPLKTDAENYIKGKKLYHGTRLSNGDFAVATLEGGLIILDSHGHLKTVFNKKTCRLQNSRVKYVYEDTYGSLWLALNDGVARIDYSSPVYFFNRDNGLDGSVLSVAGQGDRLYASTANGLFYLDQPLTGKPAEFRHVAGTSGNYYSLKPVGDTLLAASGDGVISIDDHGRITGTVLDRKSFFLAASISVPGRIWVGNENGVSILVKRASGWASTNPFQIINEPIWSLADDSRGDLWLSTLTRGVIKVENTKQSDLSQCTIKRFGSAQGLPEGEIFVAAAAGNVIFATPQGLFRFDSEQEKFVPDLRLGKHFANGTSGVFRIAQTPDRQFWLLSNRNVFHGQSGPGDNNTVKQVIFPMLLRPQVNSIFSGEQVVWFACNRGLVGYDMEAPGFLREPMAALVRKVTPAGQSALFHGFTGNTGTGKAIIPAFEYNNRHMRFDVAFPFFQETEKIRFRYFLEGFDDKWSDWTDFSFKDFRNLDPGSYAFRVEAKNVYGSVGSQGAYKFRLMSPWYLTWWAYLLYAAFGLFSLYLVIRWRIRELEKEKLRLEGVVEERTREINTANAQLKQKTILLEEQSEQLKELDEAKSRFFANISHEFRTPLSLIMGPLDQIRTESADSKVTKRIDLAYRNTLRLMSLINQLLDISKLESGKMKLQAEEADLVGFLKALAEPFQLAVERQQLELVLDFPGEPVPVYFDGEKFEKIINNLLSNAVKFTPPGGSIKIAVTPLDSQVSIVVKDTGIGISPEQLEHIFDRFYQAETTVEYRQKGSGIGLALARELVELHHGEISVTSSLGGDGQKSSGTEFTVRLPLGCGHLSAAEIASMAPEPTADLELPDTPSQIGVEAVDILSAVDAVEAGEPTDDLQPGTEERKEIILIVEDNADLRYYIRSSLEPDYQVEEAPDGYKGIQKAKEIIPDLIISDIMMPEADGYELCKTVKGEISTSHIPVILLTARASEKSILQGLDSGADDYITKPFNTHILCARVRNLIDLRRQLQQNLNREMVMQPNRMAVSKIDREFLEDLQQVIEKNLSDPEFNVEDLSRRLYMSRTTVYRKIQALSGETPTDFIRSYRLKRAAQLLQNNFGSVTEVAFEVGFSSRAYFTKCFKEKFQRLPSEYPS